MTMFKLRSPLALFSGKPTLRPPPADILQLVLHIVLDRIPRLGA